MHARHLLISLAVWAAPIAVVQAQSIDPLAQAAGDPLPARQLASCLEDADQGARESCIGISVAACTAEALTTVDMLGCLAPETEIWEARLSAAFDALRAVYVEQDGYDDPARALAPRLEAYQAQWTAWREAKCGFEYDKFRGGSMGRIASADCRLEETARRALELEDLIAEAGL